MSEPNKDLEREIVEVVRSADVPLTEDDIFATIVLRREAAALTALARLVTTGHLSARRKADHAGDALTSDSYEFVLTAKEAT